MTPSQPPSPRVFQKIVDQIIGTRLSFEYRAVHGQYQGAWFYVPNIICRPNQGETVMLTIEITPKPEAPGDVPIRDLQPLLEGAVEIPSKAMNVRSEAA
jgi:hypothetical protein